MELQSNAQILEEVMVDEPTMVLTPVSIEISEEPSVEPADMVSAPEEFCNEEPLEIVIEDLGEIPGLAGNLDPEKEKLLEVVEDDTSKKDDENDARKSKKADQWDWESKGSDGFLEWVQDRFKSVPKHSGYDTAGLERAVSYLDRLDNEISKAMRLDLDGKLDADKVEDIRAKIQDGVERLQERLDKINSKKGKKKKKSTALSSDDSIVKEAQKITGIKGVYISAPLFISCITRILLNGHISAGHDIEDMFKKLVKKYKLTDREKLEVVQLLADMGFPVLMDRGLYEEDFDMTSSDNMDFSAQYKG